MKSFKKSFNLFLVKKQNLLAVAGSVWLVAGFNVARMGLIAYGECAVLQASSIMLSLLVFTLFGLMFYKMAGKHSARILGYQEEKRPIWNFFDLKAYCIMIFMMGGGIWLRSSGLAPRIFIAVFYSGLGCALSVAGIVFWRIFLRTFAAE